MFPRTLWMRFTRERIFLRHYERINFVTRQLKLEKNLTLERKLRITLISCSMIQKVIRELTKLETAYLLHGRCYYLHIFTTRNFKKIQNNIKQIVL